MLRTLRLWRALCDPRNRGIVFGVFMCASLIIYLVNTLKRPPALFIDVMSPALNTHYTLAVRARTPMRYNITVVMLHSDWYDSSVWERINTLHLLAQHGYRALALDLPGYGYSLGKAPEEHFDRAVVLEHALVRLNATECVVIVTPSMSGTYALPILVRGTLKLKGFVALAPHFVDNFSHLEYQDVATPTLLVYGTEDTTYGAPAAQHLRHIPDVHMRLIQGAGHDCYVDYPEKFHVYLLSFLERISK